MHLRRIRGARLRRTGSVVAVAALVLLASGCWTSYGYDLNNSRAVESKITPANAGQLHELWRVSGTVGSTSTPAARATLTEQSISSFAFGL